jgi:hypothetical protein
VTCGEVHWNLRLSSRADAVQECRLCGSELRAERRRPLRRFERLLPEKPEIVRRADARPLGPSATS